MLEFLRKHASVFLLLFAVWGAWFLGKQTGTNEENQRWQQEVHNAYIKKDDANRITQSKLDEISMAYQQDLAEAEKSANRIIAGLHSDNKRLQLRIKPTQGTTQGDGRCLIDGKAELDDRDAQRLIGVTQRGDAWIKALQDTIKELQKEGQ